MLLLVYSMLFFHDRAANMTSKLFFDQSILREHVQYCSVLEFMLKFISLAIQTTRFVEDVLAGEARRRKNEKNLCKCNATLASTMHKSVLLIQLFIFTLIVSLITVSESLSFRCLGLDPLAAAWLCPKLYF